MKVEAKHADVRLNKSDHDAARPKQLPPSAAARCVRSHPICQRRPMQNVFCCVFEGSSLRPSVSRRRVVNVMA